jgi:uncharacterized protein with LGFP repeats
MRKHQQFTYTLGPFSDIQSTTNSNNIIEKFYNGYIFWHPQFGVNEVHSGITSRWIKHGGENGALGYPISNEHNTYRGRQITFEKGHIA